MDLLATVPLFVSNFIVPYARRIPQHSYAYIGSKWKYTVITIGLHIPTMYFVWKILRVLPMRGLPRNTIGWGSLHCTIIDLLSLYSTIFFLLKFTNTIYHTVAKNLLPSFPSIRCLLTMAMVDTACGATFFALHIILYSILWSFYKAEDFMNTFIRNFNEDLSKERRELLEKTRRH